MAGLTFAGRQRLDRLRRANPRIDYSWEGQTWGGDPSRSIAVCIDQTAWVVDTHIEALSSELRTPSGFATAVRSAYVAADLMRLAEGAARNGRDREMALRGDELLSGARRFTASHLDQPEPVVMPERGVDYWPANEVRLKRDRDFTGSSRHGDITVEIRWDNGCLGVAAEPSWLRTASTSEVQAALSEAFADGYQKGEDL